jgi:hypothetical protein
VAPGAAHKSPVRRRLEHVAEGLGLQDPAIASKLGGGLCRLWGLDPKGAPEQLREAVVGRMIELTQDLTETERNPQRTLARVNLNITSYPEIKGMRLTKRRKWFGGNDRKSCCVHGAISPDSGYSA